MIPDRLPSCDRWHPETPSRIAMHNNCGRKRKKAICNECTRLRVAEYRVGYDYGMLPRLTWTPPQL